MNYGNLNLKTSALLAVVLLATAGHCFADAVILRQQTSVTNDKIRLNDIAVLDGQIAEELTNIIVAEFKLEQTQIYISLDSLRQLLNAQKVNWGKLSLRGFDTCRVQRSLIDDSAITAEQSAPVVSNSVRPLDVASPLTVKEKITQTIIERSGYDKQQLRIKFNERNQQLLNQSIVVGRWVIEPTVSGRLGRIPFTIRHYQQDANITNYRLTVDVARKVNAVVTTRNISHNQTIAPSDVKLQEVFITNTRLEPLADTALAVGKVCASMLRAGSPVSADRLRSKWLIRRGDMVTVRCVSGLLEIKTTARAQVNGYKDQLIEIKNIKTREVFLARVIRRGEVLINVNQSQTQSAMGDNS